MRRSLPAFALLCLSSALASPALADRVVLQGGSVLEGTAVKKGGKVTVQIESGVVTLPADAVLRIEKGESPVGQFEARYGALASSDVAGRLALADYCRDHDMRAREHQLLLEVVDRDPDNAVARSRLGYVKLDGRWASESEAMQAKGMVRRDGRWLTREEALEQDRLDASAEAAARRNREEADLEARRATVEAQKANLEAQRANLENQRMMLDWQQGSTFWYPPSYAPFTTFTGTRFAPFRPFDGCRDGEPCARRARPVWRATMPASPFDTTSMSVVKVPHSR